MVTHEGLQDLVDNSPLFVYLKEIIGRAYTRSCVQAEKHGEIERKGEIDRESVGARETNLYFVLWI